MACAVYLKVFCRICTRHAAGSQRKGWQAAFGRTSQTVTAPGCPPMPQKYASGYQSTIRNAASDPVACPCLTGPATTWSQANFVTCGHAPAGAKLALR